MTKKKTAPLSNHCMYDGHDVDDAREACTPLFGEVIMDPIGTKNPFRLQINGVQLNEVAIGYFNYASGALAGPVAPLDRHTLQLNPKGTVLYRFDGDSAPADANTGIMLSAGQLVRNSHYGGNDNIALNVQDETLRNYLAHWSGEVPKAPFVFKTVFDATKPATASMLRLIYQFIDELNEPGGILEIPAAVATFEHAVITSLLFGLEHNYSDVLQSATTDAGLKQVRKVEEYLEANATQPIDIKTVAQEAGSSMRSIYRAFQKYRGYSPTQYLVEVRMQLAHQRMLVASANDSVSRIAMECGFVHLGRFSANYKRRFGEKPSQTIQRSPARVGNIADGLPPA